MNYFEVDEIIKKAFKEDFCLAGDITTDSIFDNAYKSYGKFISKSEGILCGVEVVKRIYQVFDSEIIFKPMILDGTFIKSKDVIAEVHGKSSSLLKCERLALNFLQHLSGIATEVKKLSHSLNRPDVKIVDTRKTLPGLRYLQKYAVKTGGGYNHRFGLYDLIMIKENHIKAAGGLKDAVTKVKNNLSHSTKIEVECENIEEVRNCLKLDVDIIMLDNMKYEEMEKACDLINGKTIIEISGNITSSNIASRVGNLPVDVVSCGYITHSARALDISFLI
ncbi:MAG: carboxylating nicotinate-nucleotide diphosphorylase [Candidatus Muiribacteriota bacterium]